MYQDKYIKQKKNTISYKSFQPKRYVFDINNPEIESNLKNHIILIGNNLQTLLPIVENYKYTTSKLLSFTHNYVNNKIKLKKLDFEDSVFSKRHDSDVDLLDEKEPFLHGKEKTIDRSITSKMG